MTSPGTRILESSVDSTIGMFRALTEAQAAYTTGLLRRGATPVTVVGDLVRWWVTMANRRRPTWVSPHRIVREWPLARLRDFSTTTDPGVRPTLILPPQAGHNSCVVDFAPQQSQVRVALEAGLSRLWSLDWIGATDETRDAGIEDYLALLDETTDLIGEPVNLIGDCQGGWLATLYAALRPERINALIAAGAPIDFHAGEGLIHDWLQTLGADPEMRLYRSIVRAHGGVMPGALLLAGFIALQPEVEVDRQAQLLVNLHKPEHVARYQAFEAWYKHTQPVSGRFYLWIVRHLFRDNELIRGELSVGGQRVDLAKIASPVFLIGGRRDHITPSPQVFALANAVSTAPDQIHQRLVDGGHLGLFIGHDALYNHWAPILRQVRDLS